MLWLPGLVMIGLLVPYLYQIEAPETQSQWHLVRRQVARLTSAEWNGERLKLDDAARTLVNPIQECASLNVRVGGSRPGMLYLQFSSTSALTLVSLGIMDLEEGLIYIARDYSKGSSPDWTMGWVGPRTFQKRLDLRVSSPSLRVGHSFQLIAEIGCGVGVPTQTLRCRIEIDRPNGQ
jgi:hypothetical protein